MDVTMLQGIDLTETQIELMNKQRIIEYGDNTKDFRKNELESTFFFLTDCGQVKAFGMLKPVIITYSEQQYPISGIGNIIALEKSQGCGKRLMEAIKNHLESKNATGIGFCRTPICPFYIKCGFQVEYSLSSRFRYPYGEQDGQNEKLEQPLGVICFEGADLLISRMLTSDALIYTNVPFW